MARPKKNTNVPKTKTVEGEDFEKVLDIPDANERSSELAKLDLTEGQKEQAQDAAKEDFLSTSTVEPVEPTKEVDKPLNNKIRNTIDELDGKGIAVSYPSNEAKWDNDLYERLNRLNK